MDKSWKSLKPGHNASVKRTSAALVAVPLTAAMLLAACGTDPKPDATPTSAPSPTTTASPTVSPTTDPNIPAAARAHTPAGAAALVRYFHDQLNVAWGQPRSGLLAPLSLPTCKTCRTLEDTSADLVRDHQRMNGNTMRIDSVDPSGIEPNGDQSVVVAGAQLSTSIVDSAGRKIREIPADRVRFFATTRWTARGWLIAEIQVLK